MSVKAEAHSDDRAVEVQFDATPYFEQASDDDIISLSAESFGAGDASDEVAIWSADDNEKLAEMFNYVEIRHRVEDCGFTCYVDRDSLLGWVTANRPHLLVELAA